MRSETFTIDEWFVVALAHTIRDREVTFHGFASPCAQVAMHLAKRTHAPNMLLVEGAMYALNPTPPFIPPTSNDRSLSRGASYSMRFEEFFDAAIRGDVDRMFVSGGQIDRFGNTNVTRIGMEKLPKVKLGGGGGGCNVAATVKSLSIWTTNHRSGRCLVESVDFVTDMGHQTRAGSRQDLGHSGKGPEWLVTELGIFDFSSGSARMVGIFPDVTIDEVREATGFDAQPLTPLPGVPPPLPEEVALVRAIDPLEVRKREFRPNELSRRFDGEGRPL